MVRGGPPSVARPVIFTFAADHGVVAEGVSAYPQSVTAQMVENFLRGGAAVNVLARDAGARVIVADFGVANAVPRSAALIDCRLGAGTANMARGPAMTREQAIESLDAGARLAEEAIAEGADLLGTGEMGIGNTTAASAITAAITGAPVEAVTGRGSGIDEAAWRRKVEVVRRALEVNRPDPSAPWTCSPRSAGSRSAAWPASSWLARRTASPSPSTASSPPPRRSSPSPWRRRPAGCCSAPIARRSPATLTPSRTSGSRPISTSGCGWARGRGPRSSCHLARAAARIYTEMATFKSAGVDGPR